MALGPGLPEPSARGEKRLTDQAVFLGDWGRTGRAQQSAPTNSGKSRFREVLDEEADDEEELSGPSADSKAEPGVEQQGESSSGPTSASDAQLESNQKDAERQSRRGGEDEAEKASGSHWRGPHPAMGLAMLPLPQQLQAQLIEKQGKAQGQKDASGGKSSVDGPNMVDSALLQALRQAGLGQPLTGFDDPRLRPQPHLDETWSRQDFPGGSVIRWDGGTARQVLRWTPKESLLETVGGGLRQVIQKLGDEVHSQTTPWEEGRGFEVTPDQLKLGRPTSR